MKLRTAALASATLLALGPAGLTHAAPADETVLEQGFVGPLHLAVGPGKAVTVAESFAGRLTTVAKGQTTSPYSAPGWDVAGVEYRGSTLYFLESVGAGPMDPRDMVGSLKAIDNKGTVTTVTDQLAQYDLDRNVDAAVQYALSPADAAAHPECVAQLAAAELPASYTGADVEGDSHVYALTIVGNTGYVTDAGSNAVFSVNLRTGAIDTVAVLPAQPVHISPAVAEAMDVPACAGLDYGFEAVPTDIEMGPDGKLYVALLPGGPEDPSLGARGSVYTVDPASGAIELYVAGLMSPTGIALDGDGNLYVASLFGEGIYQVDADDQSVSLFHPAAMAVAVEISGSTMYATTGAFGNGTLISVPL